jgi:CheY-like chemotaxis protein
LGAIKADPSQIEQVVMNLSVNARGAMPAGGSLIIATADRVLKTPVAEQFGEIPPGTYVTVSVTDTGCGMTPDVLTHMFEPFFTTKPVGKGTGLGLATCFGIMKQSGGHIAVTSAVGRGTRFCLYLPRVAEEAGTLAAPRLAEDETRPHGTETILLVEDDEMVRELAAETLRELGYTVLPADNGEAALQQVREPQGRKIDLVVTDVVMPLVSGRELADTIRLTNQQMRILFVSGYTDDEIVPQGLLRPGVDFLQKPYTGTALAKRVRDMLDSPRPPEAR